MAAVDIGAHHFGLATHLRVAHTAQPTPSAAAVVVDHHALTNRHVLLRDAWPALQDDPARLVPADDHAVKPRLAVQVQVAAADARGAHREDNPPRTGPRVG